MVHMEYFDDTLSILHNFVNNFFFKNCYLHSNSFLKVLEKLQSVIKIFHMNNLLCQKHPSYRYISKSIVKELNDKLAQIMVFGTWINLNQVYYFACNMIPRLRQKDDKMKFTLLYSLTCNIQTYGSSLNCFCR